MSCGLAVVGGGLAVARCTYQVQTNNAPFGNNPNAGHYKHHCASFEEGDHIWALMYVLRPRSFTGRTQYNGLLHSKVVQLRWWGAVRSPTFNVPSCAQRVAVCMRALSVGRLARLSASLSLSYLSLALSWCVAKIGLYSREVSITLPSPMCWQLSHTSTSVSSQTVWRLPRGCITLTRLAKVQGVR